MSSAVITLYGMSKFFSMRNDDLFKNLVLPVGIDKETLISNIIMRGAEFEVLYSDAYFFQEVIGPWSNKWNRTFTKWIDALNIEYSPLENYDRFEEWDETDSGNVHNTAVNVLNDSITETGQVTAENSDTLTLNSTRTNNDTSNVDSTTDTKISAFNSAIMEPNTTDIVDSSTVNTGSEVNNGSNVNEGLLTTDTTNTTNALKNSTLNDDTEHNKTNKRVGRAHGNIGVTTSQQMLEAELKLAYWNIYEHITDIFLSEFIIPIY